MSFRSGMVDSLISLESLHLLLEEIDHNVTLNWLHR